MSLGKVIGNGASSIGEERGSFVGASLPFEFKEDREVEATEEADDLFSGVGVAGLASAFVARRLRAETRPCWSNVVSATREPLDVAMLCMPE